MNGILKLLAVVGSAALYACDAEPDLVSSNSDLVEPSVAFFSDAPASANPFAQSDATDETADSTKVTQGEIGFLLDLRHFAKSGHRPAMVHLVPVNDLSEFFPDGIQVPLGRGSYMGQYSRTLEYFAHEGLNDVRDQLESGVDFRVSIYDADAVEADGTITGAALFDHSEVEPLRKLVFSSAPDAVKVIVPDLADLYTELTLRADAHYFIEQVDLAGNPLGKGMYYDSNNNRFISKGNIPLSAVPGEAEVNKYLFRFYKWPGENRYSIQNVHTGKFIQDWDYHYDSPKDPHSVLISSNRWTIDAVKNGTWTGTHIFRFEKRETGSYELFTYRGRVKTAAGDKLISSNYWPGIAAPAIETRWRVVSTNVDWQLQTLDSEMLEPIIGPPQIGIAYDTQEINCSAARMNIETGVERSTTTTLKAEWQETLSTLSSMSHSLGWAVSVDFGGPVGPTYGGSLSGEHTWTMQNSRSVTDTTGSEASETVVYSTSKSIEVPPFSGVRVKATYETYDDIQVLFAQRLLMRGVERSTGLYLNGQEIKTQLLTTGFNGVIEEPAAGDEHVVVSLMSRANVSNLVKGYNTLLAIEPDCRSESSL